MFNRILRTASATLIALATFASLEPLQAQLSMRSTRVANGVSGVLYVTAPVGDFGRLFLVQQGGNIRILDLTTTPPTLLATPFITVPGVAAGGEQGLLGLAFHPDYTNNGFFYVYHTNAAGNNTVERYQANPPFATSGTANPASMAVVLTISHPTNSNHNGGWIAFGPDNYLYIATGDGGSGNDPPNNAQNLNQRLGKMLRVDINGDDFPGDPANNYANPPTNPFFGATPGLDEIFHYGLRNPWRNSFDRLTGDLWIGDVGQNAIEEVDFAPAGQGGLNFGWRCMEGNNCTGLTGCICNGPTLTMPAYAYSQTGGHCSVIGGSRYRGSALCSYQGLYFFADYCSARIWTFEWNGSSISNLTDRTTMLAPGGGLAINSISGFGEDAAGELYICDLGGEVFKIIPGPIIDCNQNTIHDGCDIAGGTSHDWNGNNKPDECEPVGTAGCFGDGTTSTPCPCANTGAVGRGCDNSGTTGGAKLEGAGTPALDDVSLASSGELPLVLTIFLQGDVLTSSGIVFGDGVRCVDGNLKRLYVKNANASGMSIAPTTGDPSMTAASTALGDPNFPGSGLVRYYQTYYRDPVLSFCAAPPGDSWNASGMLTITW